MENEEKIDIFREYIMGRHGFIVTSDTTYCTSLCFDWKRALSLTRRLWQVAGPFQLSRSQGATYWGGNDGGAFKAVSRLHVIDGLNNITLNGANTQAGFNCAPPLCHSHLIRLAASSSFHKLWPAAEQHYKASLSNIPSKSAIKSYGTTV